MNSRTCAAGAWALVLLALMSGQVRAQCRNVQASVAVDSSRNASGHWETKVLLKRRSDAPGRGAKDLHLEVQPSTTVCGAVRVDAVQVTLTGPPPQPGPGYVNVPGVGYYKIHPELLSWAEAKEKCETEGAYLLVINSEAEDKAIQELMKQAKNLGVCMHIGFNDIHQEGSYITIFGEPLSALGYARWDRGQPDDYNRNEDCGSVFTATGSLNDLPCPDKHGFICEQRVD